MHSIYKVGNYWKNISGFEERAMCEVCHCEESMEHILTKCKAPGQEIIWQAVGKWWGKRTGSWMKPLLSGILACGAVRITTQEGKVKRGD